MSEDQRLFDVFERYIMGALAKNGLTHSFPMHPFSTPWKHQKTARFSVFSGERKGDLGKNTLIKLCSSNEVKEFMFALFFLSRKHECTNQCGSSKQMHAQRSK